MRWVVVAYQEFSELVMTTVEDYVAAWEAGEHSLLQESEGEVLRMRKANPDSVPRTPYPCTPPVNLKRFSPSYLPLLQLMASIADMSEPTVSFRLLSVYAGGLQASPCASTAVPRERLLDSLALRSLAHCQAQECGKISG